ncbi:hypothetical protein Salat_0844300 [Sesamum alatum]|uniref:Uncharacterized protein n=1 Tax=Sesamum alatum TaxID=300844 RepID=A0AAE1YIF5_9LAMI|nr:hypothetical protein Salat_0844300 [Sesamum alatum]
MALFAYSYAQGLAPLPAPVVPSNDGTTMDQGIAYVLLLVALAITLHSVHFNFKVLDFILHIHIPNPKSLSFLIALSPSPKSSLPPPLQLPLPPPPPPPSPSLLPFA